MSAESNLPDLTKLEVLRLVRSAIRELFWSIAVIVVSLQAVSAAL